MKKIIVASNNENKINEIKAILKDFPFEIISLREADISVEVEEDGTTFLENAHKKAKEIFNLKKDCMVLADDSGLEVETLNGAPGVYSARFAGEHGNSKKNNEKLLRMLEGKSFEDRKAKFVCALVLILADNKFIEVQGEAEGYITDQEKGKDGFGYDPLFYVKEYNKTFAQMKSEEKNKISHRAKALKMLRCKLKDITAD